METTLGQAVLELQTEIWEHLEKVSGMPVLVLHSCFCFGTVTGSGPDWIRWRFQLLWFGQSYVQKILI